MKNTLFFWRAMAILFRNNIHSLDDRDRNYGSTEIMDFVQTYIISILTDTCDETEHEPKLQPLLLAGQKRKFQEEREKECTVDVDTMFGFIVLASNYVRM